MKDSTHWCHLPGDPGLASLGSGLDWGFLQALHVEACEVD